MRQILATLAWLVATLALTAAIGTGWAATHVQDEDGFVEMSSRLGDDREVQQTAASLAGEAFADQPRVPAVLHDQAASAMRRAVLALTSSPDWDEAWRETTRRTHERLFSDPPPADVRVDIAPVVGVAIDEVTAVLPVDLPAPRSLPVVVSEDDPAPFVRYLSRAESAAVGSLAVAGVAGLLAVLLARRRWRMVAELGLSAVIAAATWWLIGRLVVPRVVEREAEATAYGRELHDVLTDRIVSSLDPTLLWVALAGAVVAVGAGALALVSARRA